MSFARKSLGAILQYTTGGTDTYDATTGIRTLVGGSLVAIGGVRDISGPSLTVGTTDATTHGDDWALKVTDVADGNDLTFDINYGPTATAHQYLFDSLEARRLEKFVLSFPDLGTKTVWTFLGFVTGLSPSLAVRGNITASVTITVTDNVVDTPGS